MRLININFDLLENQREEFFHINIQLSTALNITILPVTFNHKFCNTILLPTTTIGMPGRIYLQRTMTAQAWQEIICKRLTSILNAESDIFPVTLEMPLVHFLKGSFGCLKELIKDNSFDNCSLAQLDAFHHLNSLCCLILISRGRKTETSSFSESIVS